ncbi:hypothetical protein C8A00DRAFT_35817, partial [Chaetomidium leptoderma]
MVPYTGCRCYRLDFYEAWDSIPWTISTPTLHGLPTVVRDFYVMSQLVAKAPVCSNHQAEILSKYLETHSSAEYRVIGEFCRVYDVKPSSVLLRWPSSLLAEEPQRWIQVLAVRWPLAASAIPRERARELVGYCRWECMIMEC